MFRQCGLPLALSKPTLGVEDNFVFHRGHPALPCAAFVGPPGPAFSFLPFFCPFVLPPAWRDWLSLIQVCRCPGFVHNWLTRAQQGGFAASLVSFPYLAVKTAHRATQGRVWFSPPFPGTLLLRKSRKLALQVVIHRIVNGKDRVKQRPVSRSAVQCPHRCRQRFDEILVL